MLTVNRSSQVPGEVTLRYGPNPGHFIFLPGDCFPDAKAEPQEVRLVAVEEVPALLPGTEVWCLNPRFYDAPGPPVQGWIRRDTGGVATYRVSFVNGANYAVPADNCFPTQAEAQAEADRRNEEADYE